MSQGIFDKLVDPNKGIRLLFTIETDLNNCGENWPSQDDEVWEKIKAAKDDKEKDSIMDNWHENCGFVRPIIKVNGTPDFFNMNVSTYDHIVNQRGLLEAYCFFKNDKFILRETSVKYNKHGGKYHCNINISIKKKDILKIHQSLEKFLTLSSNYYEKLGQIDENEQYFDDCSEGEIFPYLTEEEFYVAIAEGDNQLHWNNVLRNYSLLFEDFLQTLIPEISYQKTYLSKGFDKKATKAEIKRENLRYDI
tara:strand:- start:416 stop:1165 length:750 start_codon:yes stop_codon:yes gene_type:complete